MVCDCVHPNPARAGLVRPEDALSVYGWCPGGPEFRRQSLEQMAGAMGEHHDGEER